MKTQKAIKKPIPVEFIQLSTINLEDVYEFIHGCRPYPVKSHDAAEAWDRLAGSYINAGYMPLKTLESGGGTQNADFGDYILKGIDGECWPVKPSIFERTYDII